MRKTSDMTTGVYFSCDVQIVQKRSITPDMQVFLILGFIMADAHPASAVGMGGGLCVFYTTPRRLQCLIRASLRGSRHACRGHMPLGRLQRRGHAAPCVLVGAVAQRAGTPRRAGRPCSTVTRGFAAETQVSGIYFAFASTKRRALGLVLLRAKDLFMIFRGRHLLLSRLQNTCMW